MKWLQNFKSGYFTRKNISDSGDRKISQETTAIIQMKDDVVLGLGGRNGGGGR